MLLQRTDCPRVGIGTRGLPHRLTIPVNADTREICELMFCAPGVPIPI
jgi:hypothetical protein